MADTDQEIFAEALKSEAPAETPVVTETEQPEPAKAEGDGPVRDPATGKFVAKDAATASQPEASATPAPDTKAETPPAPKADTGDHRVPLTEHLREREERQAAQRERDDLRRQMEAMSRRLEEATKPKGEPPDIYTDANAFVRAQIDPVQKAQEAMVDRFSRLMATEKFGAEVVNAAYAELEAAVHADPRMRLEAQRIWQAEHPYGELVTWQKSRSALKEIGSDPTAYKARLREEFLNDPEVQKAVIAKMQAANSGQSNANGSRPSNITRLPPSLNRVTAAAPNTLGDEETQSDAELFRDTVRRR